MSSGSVGVVRRLAGRVAEKKITAHVSETSFHWPRPYRFSNQKHVNYAPQTRPNLIVRLDLVARAFLLE